MVDIRAIAKSLIIDVRRVLRLFTGLDREVIAAKYLKGTGIELGALHNPVRVPSKAKVRYVDRMTVEDLRSHYPELASRRLVGVDIIDDGETLLSFEDGSQDFVIANHFLEHCQNPIGALQNMLRVLRVGGVLYLALPDKRFTFDLHRSPTGFDHLLRDFREGPEWSREEHFKDWVTQVERKTERREIEKRAHELMEKDYSIHYHVWTETEMLEMIQRLRTELGFPLEVKLFYQNEGEGIFILEKKGNS